MHAKKMAPANRDHQLHPSVEIVAEASEANKQFATLQAHAARAGWRLDRCAGHFILHRWNRAIDCADLPAARAALLRVGVPL